MVYINMSRSKIKKKNRKIKNKKIIPLNSKASNNDISRYPFVEIEWFDIEGDAGWNETTTLEAEKLPVCVSTGYLLSQKKGVTRIFRDYIESKDTNTFEDIGSTVIIPTSVIVSIKKINLN